MNASERRRHILKRVNERQVIETQDLALELGVSAMTIRRDIKLLEHEGFIRQTYGGASVQVARSIELSFNARVLEHAEHKRRIGAYAAGLIRSGQTLFLGPGTTTAHVAQLLPAHPHLTVVTASLSHASLLRSRNIRVVVIGGTLVADELYMTGSLARGTVEKLYADVCLIGVCGVDLEIGLTEMDLELAALHHTLMTRSAQTVVLADHSKFGYRAPAVVAPVSQVDLLITDQLPKEQLEAYRAAGVRLTVLEDPATQGETASHRVLVGYS